MALNTSSPISFLFFSLSFFLAVPQEFYHSHCIVPMYVDMSHILLRNSKDISSRKIIAGVAQVHTPLQVPRKDLQPTYTGLKHGHIPTLSSWWRPSAEVYAV